MDRDDILDDMSLSSDDEMLEDMINEMKEEVKKPTPAPQPRVARPVNTVAPIESPARWKISLRIMSPRMKSLNGSKRFNEMKQKNDHNPYSRNLSRSYRTKVDAMPTANLEASTLLQELLIEAVRNAKCKPSPSWDEAHLGIHRQLKDQGVGDIYARELRVLLKHRAVNNPDYAANPGRFPKITSHLATA
ncbi:hypothetical protein Ae201684P_002997 [Aphanomyces euteiches]|nr:hypothetical protein Ae201684P_002997 [Aphanomyces euteiches]